MKRLAILLLLSAAIGCRTVTPSTVITESRGGEKYTMQEVEKTGDRFDIPVGENAGDIVSIATFSHAGGLVAKVVVTKSRWNPWSKPKTYGNCNKCHIQSFKELGLDIAQPKNPWYKWPLIILIVAGLIAAAVFLDKLKSLILFWK